MRLKIETLPNAITAANVDQMREALRQAIKQGQELVVMKGEVLNALHSIRHYKTANKNVATHLKTKIAGLRASVSEQYGNMRLVVAWGDHNYNYPRSLGWRYEKGDSVETLIAKIDGDLFELSSLDAAINQLNKFDLILEAEAELRLLAIKYVEVQKEVKAEVFGRPDGGYFHDPLRLHLTALCAN